VVDEAQMRKYEIEIERLDEQYADLEQLWTKVPRYGWLVAFAPLVWILWGFGWTLVELLVVASLVGTQAYLIGVRKSENRWNRASLVEDLNRLRSESATASSPVP
jgi:type II secretory pathway pseudopilin PulG